MGCQSLLLLGCVLRAVIAMEERGQVSAKLIASSSTSVGQFGDFTGFTFPLVAGGSAGGTVMFSGSFSNNAALVTYEAASGTWTDGINASTPVTTALHRSVSGQRSPSKLALQGLGGFALAKHVAGTRPTVVFTATAKSAMGTSVDGVFLQTASMHAVMPVATTEDVFAPIGAAFTSFGGTAVAVSKQGNVIHIVFEAEAGSWRGIVYAQLELGVKDVAPTLSLVVDGHAIIPGSPNANFTCLSSPTVSGSGDVFFFGSHCSDSRVSSKIAEQFAANTYYRTQRRQSHCLFRNVPSQLARHYEGIYKWSSSAGVTPLATFADAVPKAIPAQVFDGFSAPSVGADGTVAFIADGNVSSSGIYAVSPQGVLRCVADTAMSVPDADSGLFGDFPNDPSVGQAGEVAFYASAPAPLSGIYAEVPSVSDENRSAIELVPQLTMADKVAGQALVFIGFGANAYDSLSGTIATYLVLDNNVYGVWALNRTASHAVGESATLV